LECFENAFEALLRYLVCLAVTDLFQCLAHESGGGNELPDHHAFDFLRKPTKMLLGKWVEALRETALLLRGRTEAFVPELPAECEPGGAFDVDVIGPLVKMRNEATHPGLPMTTEECQAMLKEFWPKLLDALHRAAFVRRYPLGFFTAG